MKQWKADRTSTGQKNSLILLIPKVFSVFINVHNNSNILGNTLLLRKLQSINNAERNFSLNFCSIKIFLFSPEKQTSCQIM
jgi:hypothetical protein